MGSCPAPFSDIGKKAKELLTKDYNFDQKFSLSVVGAKGLGLTATGLKRDQIFIGDLNTIYKSGNTAVDVKVDTYSNVTTKVTVSDVLPSTKAALSFKIPDNKSGKLDVQYLHPHAAFDSSIGLNPNPLLELSATIGSKELCLGGEVGFDTASASFIKYNADKARKVASTISDYCLWRLIWISGHGEVAKISSWTDKGRALKASYIHYVDSKSGTTVAAELIHRFSSYQNTFTIGSSHAVDSFTIVKSRFSDDGKAAMLCQREWRPKSLITFSAEYDSKAVNAAPKLGLALALNP